MKRPKKVQTFHLMEDGRYAGMSSTTDERPDQDWFTVQEILQRGWRQRNEIVWTDGTWDPQNWRSGFKA